MGKKTDKRGCDVPVALTVAGSDNSGGAGIQADLKTMTRFGVYGCSAVTCVVAEHPGRVQNITPVPAARVRDQIELTAEAFPIHAMKTGMLYSRAVIEVIVEWLEKSEYSPQLVVDPVMVATSGGLLLQSSAVKALKERLLPQAACVTPNLQEASVLLGHKVRSLPEMETACKEAYRQWGVPFLIKGGHLTGKQAVDVLYDGNRMVHLKSDRVPRIHTHGTGCTFSAAIVSGLASGQELVPAVRKAKRYVSRTIQDHYRLGRFTPLNHIL
ncbi:MAG: bifunctional hydroxymethylpyrimidine kinase/phosphomethylpyrimidine kinase [Verrucomicrobiota bacterium]